MGTFSVRVINRSGSPISGAKVTVHYGLWSGWDEGFTNSNGWISFSNNKGNLVTGEFYVNSKSFGEHRTNDGDSYSFTL
ncbi:MAG: carboxypeptidase regulatory-like domain-containing protein [Sphingobacteriales bacterium]|nr:carboxypeptidase regulatory-like domain-containing protein [Sphingobacteriales bacterium]